MIEAVLVINAGSSSIKFAIYAMDDLRILLRGRIEAIGGTARFGASGALASRLPSPDALPANADHATAISWLLDSIRGRLTNVSLVAAGHRVVHGGQHHNAPVHVNPASMATFDRLVSLAPLHEPHNIEAIRAVSACWPDLPQVACFDTEFHRGQPRLAQLYALPHELSDAGILRYGFHGLSYEYIASVLPGHVGEKANDRVVVAHLGNGASMCAMRQRRSVASTMGFTALDGLMMGTRCGAIDPGVVLHLIQQQGLSPAEVCDLLYNRSGLLGVSGISSDVRDLETSSDPRAADALDLFAYRAAQELGSLVAVLGGLDVLVFTAGIGEHAAGVRQRICERSRWAGISIDADANSTNQTRLSDNLSNVDVLVIPTDEETVIARSTQKLVVSGSGQSQ